MERGDTSILKSWFRFNGVCCEFRHTSWNLHEFEMLAGWISYAVLWIWFGWSWDAILWTWLEVSRHQDGGETQISGPEFSWDTTQMERRDKSRGWCANLETWMRVRWDMDWVETAILRPEYVVMGLHLGFNYHDLDWDETWPGLWWGMNIGTWMDVARLKVRCEYL